MEKFGSVKLINFLTISTCITYFKWAEFRSIKTGIKIHTKFDLGTNIPETIIITNAKEHDKVKLDKLMKDRNCIYISHRAYIDYEKFDCYSQNDKYFISRLKISTEEIAWLYKKRWEIELFFKWIKQNLKIKKFIGHSLNAVMMQIISAILTFLMLKFVEKESTIA